MRSAVVVLIALVACATIPRGPVEGPYACNVAETAEALALGPPRALHDDAIALQVKTESAFWPCFGVFQPQPPVRRIEVLFRVERAQGVAPRVCVAESNTDHATFLKCTVDALAHRSDELAPTGVSTFELSMQASESPNSLFQHHDDPGPPKTAPGSQYPL